MISSNDIAFFTGQTDDTYTRSFALYNDEDEVTVPVIEYNTTKTTEMGYDGPWDDDVDLVGTDGLQFEPGLEDDDVLTVFFPELSRAVQFEFVSETEDIPQNENLDSFTYKIKMGQLNATLDNEIYDIFINGTTNLTTTLGAPSFATQGHFYGL